MYLAYSRKPEVMTKKSYDKGFIARVRVARESAGLNQKEMAEKLGVKTNTYSKYESHIMMPHFLLPTFAHETGITLTYLLSAVKTPARPQTPPKKRRLKSA